MKQKIYRNDLERFYKPVELNHMNLLKQIAIDANDKGTTPTLEWFPEKVPLGENEGLKRKHKIKYHLIRIKGASNKFNET